MVSKRFKGKPCVYCEVGISEATGDHVLARQFALEEYRANLPKVPCCRRCNGKKSQLEHYLTAILPFGGRHPTAGKTLVAVEKRLLRNKKLHIELAIGMQDAKGNTGRKMSGPLFTIPFDSNHLCDLAIYIALGLTFHHWNLKFVPKYRSYAACVTTEGDRLLTERFLCLSGDVLNGVIGGGALSYQALKSREEPWISFWRMAFYGGVGMAGHEGDTSDQIWVFFGSDKQVNEFELLLK